MLKDRGLKYHQYNFYETKFNFEEVEKSAWTCCGLGKEMPSMCKQF